MLLALPEILHRCITVGKRRSLVYKTLEGRIVPQGKVIASVEETKNKDYLCGNIPRTS